jgi:hypothetical protein
LIRPCERMCETAEKAHVLDDEKVTGNQPA